jgi:transcriptional regulator with XRE-family HTH domain
MRTTHTYSRQTLTASKVLGLEIARARRAQRWTVNELAERAGISVFTLRSIERGAPTVALGSVFEVATLLGLDLFGEDTEGLDRLAERSRERLELLPARIRDRARPVRDDF